ncbi:IS200/IS605 family element RNA-guided endonuclease TnpB [uncultured Clostridium sp.]|uniref:IS200/IS605 family element RNA-guided endonuclease TnpB n=1 Tax=uncultured Clostridium sp. TaxID=59620 RepID=UPI0032162E08
MKNKAYKFRIYPTEEQKILIQKTFGSCRFVYNRFLGLKIEMYKEEKKSLSYGQCCKQLTELKKEYEWLKEVDSDALQKELKNLNQAYENFFKRHTGFPKFKSKKNNHKSYTATQNRTMEVRGNLIKLPKLKWIKAKVHREVKGRILNATISQNPNGKYYVSLCCEEDIKELPLNDSQVGVDLGISDLAILSNGIKFGNPRFIKQSEKKLAKEQRKLAKMEYGSNNYNKQKIKVANIHEHIKSQRKDYLNNITSYLVNNFDLVCLEDLSSSNLMKNKNLSKAIADVSWFEFNRQLEYKCDWYGKKISKIDKWFPSSQICSDCGHRDGKKALNIREWVCPICGVIHDRDINASINILNEGKRIVSLQQAS